MAIGVQDIGVYSPATAFPWPSVGGRSTGGKKMNSSGKAMLDFGGGGGVPMPGGREGRKIGEGLATFRRRQQLESMSSPAGLQQMQADAEAAAFKRKTDFAQKMYGQLMGDFGGGGTVTGASMQGGTGGTGDTSEAERIMIQAQQEAADKDINRLQDVLSGAGILSSGTLAAGTGQILGSARGQIAGGLAQFAENRLNRRHQELLAKRQQLMQLISSILT